MYLSYFVILVLPAYHQMRDFAVGYLLSITCLRVLGFLRVELRVGPFGRNLVM